MSVSYKAQQESSGLFGGNATYIEELYENFLTDPESVSKPWQQYFSDIKGDSQSEVSRLDVNARFEALAELPLIAQADGGVSDKQIGVLNIIKSYRLRGHRAADIDPIKLRGTPKVDALSLNYHGLSEADLDTEFAVNGAFGQQTMVLRELLEKLKHTYSGHIGLEYAHLWEKAETAWLIEKVESAAELTLIAAQKNVSYSPSWWLPMEWKNTCTNAMSGRSDFLWKVGTA